MDIHTYISVYILGSESSQADTSGASGVEIGAVVALLLIGGIVEMWMIETAQGM